MVAGSPRIVGAFQESLDKEGRGQMPNQYSTADMWLVYEDQHGGNHYQPWQDVDVVGTLIDPDSGDFPSNPFHLGDYWAWEDSKNQKGKEMDDCLDSDSQTPCEGEVTEYYALSGSGLTYARCERHYGEYVERVQPKMDHISRRYPEHAPADFDPSYAGESWDEDY